MQDHIVRNLNKIFGDRWDRTSTEKESNDTFLRVVIKPGDFDNNWLTLFSQTYPHFTFGVFRKNILLQTKY